MFVIIQIWYSINIHGYNADMFISTQPPLNALNYFSSKSHIWSVFLFLNVSVLKHCSFRLVDWVSNELRGLLFAFGDPVTLHHQVVVDLVRDDAVLFILWMVGDKLPHPLGRGHQFSCFRSTRWGISATCWRHLYLDITFQWSFTWGTLFDELQIV